MLVLKETEMKSETIPVHIHQGKTATQHMKYQDKTLKVMLNTGHINETTTLCLPTEEEW